MSAYGMPPPPLPPPERVFQTVLLTTCEPVVIFDLRLEPPSDGVFRIHDDAGFMKALPARGDGWQQRKALLLPAGSTCRLVLEMTLRPEAVGCLCHWLVATFGPADEPRVGGPASRVLSTGVRVVSLVIPDKLRETLSR